MQIDDLWATTLENMAAGVRLIPLAATPWRWCARPGLDAARCLVLTDETHTFPLAAIAATRAVRFANLSAPDADEAAIVAAVAAEADALLCHCRVTPSGGIDNLLE